MWYGKNEKTTYDKDDLCDTCKQRNKECIKLTSYEDCSDDVSAGSGNGSLCICVSAGNAWALLSNY